MSDLLLLKYLALYKYVNVYLYICIPLPFWLKVCGRVGCPFVYGIPPIFAPALPAALPAQPGSLIRRLHVYMYELTQHDVCCLDTKKCVYMFVALAQG